MKNLTPELKANYMATFEKSIESSQDFEFNKLLTEINNNPNVQTIFTHKRNDVKDKNINSTLCILISKNVSKMALNRYLQENKDRLADFNWGTYKNPRNTQQINDEIKYFEEGTIMLTLNTIVQHNHRVFWDIAKKHLTKF